MYAKLIRNNVETIYECQRATLRPVVNRPLVKDGHPLSELFIQKDNEEESITFERHQCELIYMNSNGKTIDRKVW